jgi:hypothetical protein
MGENCGVKAHLGILRTPSSSSDMILACLKRKQIGCSGSSRPIFTKK